MTGNYLSFALHSRLENIILRERRQGAHWQREAAVFRCVIFVLQKRESPSRQTGVFIVQRHKRTARLELHHLFTIGIFLNGDAIVHL